MKISIAIPCYEMHGRGTEMLQYSLNTIKKQVNSDFEVVISDHSKNDDIFNQIVSQFAATTDKPTINKPIPVAPINPLTEKVIN